MSFEKSHLDEFCKNLEEIGMERNEPTSLEGVWVTKFSKNIGIISITFIYNLLSLSRFFPKSASMKTLPLILCFAATATLYPVSMMIKQEELSETHGETRGFL